jgi:hypothetical protein
MIRLGVRLTVNGGREALVRLVVTAAAVALGVGLLLVTVAGINAVQAQNRRIAWLNTSSHNLRPSVDEATSDPLWATAQLDEYRGSAIQRIDVAGTGPRSPVPPGIPGLPRAGEFYASPALARLLRTTPAAELGDRYPGHQVGTVGPSALASPRSLVIIIGHSVAELSQTPGAHEVRSIETAPQGTPGDEHPDRIEFILAVVAGALLLPVLIFIGAATRLAAARREERFAAMRLVGATPRQVSIVAAAEACVAAACGVAGGFALFFLLRSTLAGVPFTGQPFFPGDLSLGLSDILIIAIGVPIAAVVAARLALRRVQISPLGVARRVTPPAPRAWRVLPLLLGLAELAYFVGRRPPTTAGQIRVYGSGFVLVMAGLVIAGPWITMLISRVLARKTGRPAVLIAGRRLSDNPRAAFRAVSGLIVALFIATATVGIITTIVAYHDASTGGAAGRDVLYEELAGGPPFSPANPAGATTADRLARRLTSIRGVRTVTVVRADPRLVQGPGPGTGLVSCAQLERMPTLGRCAAGVAVASIPLGFGSGGGVAIHSSAAPSVWPDAHLPVAQLDRLPAQDLYVDAGGSPSALERARTAIEVDLPAAGTPSTVSDISPGNAQMLASWRQLADVVIIASLVIAACSLAVSVAAGLVERKRPFSLLRLTGTPLGVLRRVVALEAAAPLVAIAILSAATGLLAAQLFLRSQLSETLQPLGMHYYLIVAFGLVAALGIIAATLPLLEHITGPEAARNE